jgi:LDH2 family malate/lactate/ureidoglycolate dehydrogenase
MDDVVVVTEEQLEGSILKALRDVGADAQAAAAATRAMMHASRLGIDSHGARLTSHYVKVMKAGRVNPRPNFQVTRTAAATAVLDADDGLGHAAAYAGMTLACDIARESGVGAVGIVRSSHFGAAGAYALAGAEAGMVALSMSNTDSAVMLHGGRAPFHGTNPIAMAAPVPNERPWLLDLATSSIPFNRVLLYRTLGLPLPENVAADDAGVPTTVAEAADRLIPLGGTDFGFKGAGLAGLVTILSAVLIGSTLDHRLIQMTDTHDFATPRNLGHFCLAIDPDRFAGREVYNDLIARYLADFRASPSRPAHKVLAPGDREWAVETERRNNGIPVDRPTADFLGLNASA